MNQMTKFSKWLAVLQVKGSDIKLPKWWFLPNIFTLNIQTDMPEQTAQSLMKLLLFLDTLSGKHRGLFKAEG